MDGSGQDRMRSFNVLNTLYHESRQQLELLSQQLSAKDGIIWELRARQAGDKVLLGPASSLVDSLLREMCKLQQQRSEGDFKAARMAEEVQRLTLQLREKELELEGVRCQPDHHKDLEIQRLRADVEQRRRAEATRTVLCSSLAEEAEQLRAQLDATVRVCQELLSRLEREKKGGVELEEPGPPPKAQAQDLNAANAQIRQLEEENRQLKQRVAYVQSLNSQWQKYDSSREDYIRGLCLRLKGGVEAGPAALLSQEISRLNGLLEDKLSECGLLKREAEAVRRQDEERIQTLEQQVLIYAEDFKSERADRERAQSQMDELKEQVSQLQQQLLKQGGDRENREPLPMCRVHIGHRITSRRSKDESEPLQRSGANRKPPAAAPSDPAWTQTAGASELQCPQCLARFKDTDAAEYLNHCEECARL